MKSSSKRTLKSRQVGMVETYHLISGTAGTPADSGPDAAYISSITDNGTGDWTINVLEPSRLDLVVTGIVSKTTRTIFEVSAIDESSVRVLAKSDAGVAKDADFYISLMHATMVDCLF